MIKKSKYYHVHLCIKKMYNFLFMTSRHELMLRYNEVANL